MEASNTRFNRSNVQLDELLRGKVDVDGGVFKLCTIKKTTCNSTGIQRVSSRPLQTRTVQAMFARYVVQIELTCLY